MAAEAFAQFENLPAPMRGINAVSGLMEMEPTDALYALNVICTQNGPTVRPGYSEWAINNTGTGGVRTIIPVRGAGTAGAQDHLFACTLNGIWDVTASTTTPTQVVTFGTQSGNAGYCEYDFYVNANGDVTLMVCDEVNGYYTFDCSTTTWLKVTQGAGGTQVSNVDPATFVSVRVFGAFIWFVQGGTGTSWYNSAGGGIYGAMTSFSWGNKFAHGGNLKNLWIFTYGSAFGTYTYLIGIGDAGDVLAYQGINPSSASTWTLSGQWYIGDVPAGRRFATNYGGDLTILCAYGIIKLSSLFSQQNPEDPKQHLDNRIAPALASDFNTYGTQFGFQFQAWPSTNSLLILEPLNTGVVYKQWCYNIATTAWTIFNGLQMQCSAFWHGNLYFGDQNGRVVVASGNVDNAMLNGTSGVAINFGVLGAFQATKFPSNKIVDLVEAFFITSSPVNYKVLVQYDFDLSTLALGSISYTGSVVVGGWDSGLWDSAIWSSMAAETAQFNIQGAGGIGKWIAVGIIGITKGQTTLSGFQASFRPTKGFF